MYCQFYVLLDHLSHSQLLQNKGYLLIVWIIWFILEELHWHLVKQKITVMVTAPFKSVYRSLALPYLGDCCKAVSNTLHLAQLLMDHWQFNKWNWDSCVHQLHRLSQATTLSLCVALCLEHHAFVTWRSWIVLPKLLSLSESLNFLSIFAYSVYDFDV